MSIAVLCNAATANPTQYAHAVAAQYLAGAFTTPEPPAPAAAAGAGRGRGAEPAYSVTQPDLQSYVGRYVSEEAETELVVAIEKGDLVIKRRPDTVLRARPTEKDAFAVPSLGTVTFHRAAGGQVNELSVKLDRVWDLRFHRE